MKNIFYPLLDIKHQKKGPQEKEFSGFLRKVLIDFLQKEEGFEEEKEERKQILGFLKDSEKEEEALGPSIARLFAEPSKKLTYFSIFSEGLNLERAAIMNEVQAVQEEICKLLSCDVEPEKNPDDDEKTTAHAPPKP